MLTAIRHPSPGMSLLNSDWAVTPAMKFVHWVCEEVDQRFAGYSVYRAIRHRPRPLGLANANLLIAVCPELSPIRSEIHALARCQIGAAATRGLPSLPCPLGCGA